MKATGIVRRIDDLGRVVIPKEIRRTLRIREGDPLEIFTDRDGGVILKKYSPIEELSEFSREYSEALHQTIGHIVMICDKDTIISVSGGSKKEYGDKKISNEVDKIMEMRKAVNLDKAAQPVIPICEGEDSTEYKAQVVAPIIAEGDTVGAVIIATKEDVKLGEIELKLAETAAAFLGKQMEQ
ncbi:MAG: stage V sporulation protein T [Clostridium sp.]|uniref:stage V sporulation protein T n=1 Tax=Clostridium culturomicium TaxID=1499683 RepID=UPI0005907A3B|nr:stage V sporulation protein T [Clostridium culturomicium]MDU4892668.1 stage V sporulation protein T [Clostridium sp.]MDU7085220.1 stage V sporulation protein T [Clostridium sp.]